MDDIEQLDGPQFMELAWRLSAYGGVIAMRLQAEQDRQGGATPSAVQPRPGRAAGRDGAKLMGVPAFTASHPDLIAMRGGS